MLLARATPATAEYSRAPSQTQLKPSHACTHALADAGAIAQFYWLSESLETALARHAEHPMVARVRELGLEVTPGYASDLEQLYGPEWREKATRARTASTLAYQETLAAATPVELVAAAFILYGALVVGGGKQTQVHNTTLALSAPQHHTCHILHATSCSERGQSFRCCFSAPG